MKSLSRRMKRMLAILLVETIVAVNVISSYASDAGGIMTFSEEEVSEMASNVESASEGESSDYSEPATEEPAYEEPAEEAPQEETPAESPAAEEPQETPADPEQSPTVDPVAEEPSLDGVDAVPEETPGNEQQPAEGSEEASECTCAKACGTSEYDAECPVCCAVADLEESEREAFLKDHCSKYEEAAEEEKDNITEPEIINKESNITITGTSVADGAAIEGASDFTIEVSGEVTLSDKAPAIEGYEFSGRIYLKDTDTEVSKIKKEAVENEKKENGVVTQIVKETKLSYFDVEAEGWVELTEDTTIVYGYTKTVQEEEEAADEAVVRFYAVCVDEDGNVIDGFEKKELTVDTSLDLTKAPIAIDGYDYKEASVDGTVVLSVEKNTADEENTVYSYTTADGSVEVTEDVTVTLSYEMTEEEKAAVHFYAECVDEDGNLIGGYEKKTLRFEDTMELAKAPFEIEGYEYVEASIGEAVVLSVAKTAETDENGDEAVVCTYTTADGSVEVSEDTTLTLTYKAVKEVKEVALTWSYVDEEGLAIENVEGEPEFEDTLVLDDAEKAPVVIEGYEYVEASVDDVVITSIIKEEAVSEETTAATDEEAAEPVYVYSYTTTTGETVAIEEDTEITLSYEETGIAVKVDATVVDEFGDEIDEKYTNMELPKFTDGELVLDDVENPPVAKVQVRKSLFKVIKYTYVQATIDNKIVAAMKREATKDTADLAEKEQEFIYSYTTDGTTWTKLKEDTTVIFEYTDGKKTVYTYEDAYVSVTATLQHANAIPDDAEFVVTPVTSGTSGYNYGAYMDALNANAAAISNGSDDQKTAYDETNTLLYDIAFLAAPVDEEGNTIEGELVEYQPAEGMVNISISFKQSQLEDDLAAKDEKDITVVHMPLSDSVKESLSTTADATGISASDINVEVVSDSTSVAGEKTEFVLSDFSVVAVTAEGTKVMKAGPSVTYESVLGEAANYGIVANEMTLVGHLESNFATGSMHGNADIQASKNQGGGAGYTYIGAYDGSKFKMDLNENAGSLKIYTTEAAMRNFGSNMTGVDAGYTGDLSGVHFPTGVIIDYTTYSEMDIKSKASNMVSDVKATSATLMSNGETYGYEYSEIKDRYRDQNVIDIASLGADENGTYYINFQQGEFPICAYTIKIKSGQNVVLNIPDESVSFGQFTLCVDGTNYTTQGNSNEEVVCENVIFNCPNATYAKTCGATTGTFLVPNADFDNDSVAAGFLVANNIRKIGGQEWHSISKNIPVVNPTSFELTAAKTVNGKTPSADENGLFTFILSSVDANGNETVIETVKNNGSAITFRRFDNIKQAGTYWYKIQETGTVDGYGIDNTLYYAKVEVTSVTQDLVTNTNATVTYYKGSMDGEACGVPTFRNTKVEKGALSVTKSVAGTTTAETFYFKVSDAQGTSVSWDGKTVFAIKSGETVTLTELPMGTYAIQETDASGVAIAYDAAKFPYQVTYSSSNVLVNADQTTSATITNTYNPSKVSVSGVKVWDDNENQDGKRTESVTINLFASGVKADSKTVTAAENWEWSFTDLDEYQNGKKIVYTITEDAITGYTTAITGDAVSGYVVTNTHTPETVDIFGEKVWDDNNNQDGVRPNSITIKLLADGKDTGKTTTTTAGQDWKWSFTDLAKYADGKEITYTVTEEAVANYTTSSIIKDEEKGFVITNTHTPETVAVSGTKTWVDNDDQDGVRPESIKITLKADGVVVDSKTVTAKDNWQYSFTDLAKYKNVAGKGVEIQYTITEDVVEGYTTTYEGYDITNTHTPGKTSRTVTKVWNDQDNQDGARPAEIKVQLYAGKTAYGDEVVLNAANNWSYTWENLPEKEQKKTIAYTVKEVGEATGYTTAYSEDTFTITNTHAPATVYVKGSKIWNDQDNQDGVRPASITIQLYADGVLKDSKEVTEKDGWTWKFENLPKYAGGQQIQYSVKEVLKEADAKNYTAENISKTFDIKNTHTPVQTEISGTKTWNDANNQDGIRPASITVKLFANGVDTGKTATASAATDWKYSFDKLDKYANSSEITYTVQEINVANGYEASYSESGLDVTNTHTPETITVNGSKKWDDNNNQDGKRPTEITVILFANGTEKARENVTADASGNWSFSFTNLPKNENGTAIRYTVKEEIADETARNAYTTTIDGTTITNTHVPEITSIGGTKVWKDNNNQDGKRPSFVTVRLLADGVDTGKSVKVSEETNWTFSFTGLPKYKNGQEITYTVSEDSVDGYTATISDDVKTAITITNSYTPGKTSVSGSKKWEDANNQDGKRPTSITINLLADDVKIDSKTVTTEDNWSWSFTDLPEYKNGQKISYTISEEPVTDYKPTINGYNVTNTHTPEKIAVSGSKTWEDANNQDGKRPASITITLLANKEPVATKEVTAADNWSWTFTGLDKYKDGKEIGYSVVETLSKEAAEAYTVEYPSGSFNVVNKHTPEKVSISGTKVWNDADNQDGVRPDSIKIHLFADGTELKDMTKTVSSADNWTWEFENLDKYADGKLINYTITEEAVANYSTVISKTGDYAYTVTNSYTPGKTSKTVVKSWDDNNDQDGIRPSEIEVVLLANGEEAKVADAKVTLSEANDWTYTWSDLDLKAKGFTIKYTVQEITELKDYEKPQYSYEDSVMTITNTHKPDQVYVEGVKTWEDNDNQDGLRPGSIKINLLADGVLKESKVVTADNNWSWKFDNLPKNKVENGKSVMIRYSVTEDAVTGYEVSYPDKTFNVVNTHNPEKTLISGHKVWSDNNNQDGVRPSSITVTLYADGVATDKTATVTAENNWNFSFTDLPKYAEGQQGQIIQYTVKEADVDGYTAVITGNATEGYTITNTHEPAKIDVSGEKVWEDANNQDGLRPTSIEVTLYADGKPTNQTATVTASTDGKWSFTFENLDKYVNGKEVVYTVEEKAVTGYTKVITGNASDGILITNTHKPEKTAIAGTKSWVDSDNQDGKRPESITVNLLANGTVKESKVVSEATNWEYSFTDLDVYEGGSKITYSVQEVVPEGYTVSYDGNNITNTYNPEKTSVNGIKTWNDKDDQDGLRPTSIIVRLYADDKDTGKSVEVSAANGWQYSFEDLDKFKAGKEIVYTVKEDAVAGYTTSITGYNIENIHTPEKTEVRGSKTWDDADNQDGLRPASITIRLLADGTEDQNKTVTANDNWSWSFTDLPKYKNGKEIVYTIAEDAVTDYTTKIDGYHVTNSHKPAVIEISGTKTWNDADDQDGKRPEKIVVYLYADGKLTETKEVTDALGWAYSFKNLPKYKNVDGKGVEITYTIKEETVTDYSPAYDGYNITNSYTPEETSRTVTKLWEDGDNQDGTRPSSITVQLLANGKAYGDPVVLDEANGWTYTWLNLPVNQKKLPVKYTVEEIGKIEGYETAYSEDTFIITNKHVPAEVYVEGVKTWEDGDNQDGLRPDSITVVLLADGVEYTRMDVTPAADGTWSWKFDKLPKYANGEEIQYSIEEIAVNGYESKADYSDGKFNLVNTHTPELIELSGSKTWNDSDDQDGMRPSSITIRLLADGVEVDSRTVTAADNWSWTFENLPKNKNVDGTVSAIEYTITEDAVDGYTASYTDDGTGLINSYTPEKTGRNVVKIWDDANNADQIRPAYIEVQLYADGEAYGDAVVLNDANGWSYAWTDLQAKKGGQYIVYTVQELTNVSGYTTTVTESGTTFTIVNYHPVTPPPTPTPPTTPPSTPPDVTPTPTTPSITPTPEVPTPTPDDNEVLGARRGGAVLGARRGLDQAVLGKRRRPTTGDSAALIVWMITLFGAMGAATVSVIGLRKKEEEK